MKNTQHNDCGDIIELLVEKYWSESKSELDRKNAQIAQDFISRKLFNSTVRVNKQLHATIEYINKLMDYVIESLKEDFNHIPLSACKDKLLSVVEKEYKKLIPKTNAWLIEGNLAQKDILGSFESKVLGEIERAKEKIEIRCAISEKEKVVAKGNAEKWYQNRTIQAALIGGVFVLLAALLTTPLWVPLINKMGDNSDMSTKISTERERSSDSSDSVTTTGPNSPSIVDYNAPGSKQLHAESPPIIGRGEELIQPEEIEGDVNRPKISPIFKIPERTIAPEENAGEVNEPKKPEIIKRKESPIEPKDQ